MKAPPKDYLYFLHLFVFAPRFVWLVATQRWHIFRNASDLLVQGTAYMSLVDSEDEEMVGIREAAREEWLLRKRQRNRKRFQP